jgi:precorrin-6B C5,15-methyltransferase / cobalt-precorrin-6B C5,C15-methyltransferase
MTTEYPTPWLSIIGIGEDGLAGLSPAAKTLIESADLVFGGRRHLALVGALAKWPTPWPSPFETAREMVLSQRGRRVVVLATGDPFQHGVGSLLVRDLPADEWRSYPQVSAFSLAANRMGWALQDSVTLGVNGRAVERLIPLLHPGARILALSADASTPATVAALLTARGCGGSRITVLEALGGEKERLRTVLAHHYALADVHALNIMAIEVAAAPGARIVPYTPGLPDDWFENDGQLTKREIRALTLSSLAPKRGEHLWDLGCGSGSVAIEWMLADASLRASGIERNPERAARAARNALAFGVPGLRVEMGDVGTALDRLDPPHAVFIGGGAREAGLIDRVWAALPTGGRLVINAVTLETEHTVLAEYARKGGSLTRISIDRADAVGGLTGWRPAMPVTHWLAVKP